MLIKEVLDDAAVLLKPVSGSPRLDAELLLSKITGLSRSGMVSRALDHLDDETRARFSALVGRRMKAEPVAYLTGVREFYGVDIEVSPHALVPRPETELLVDLVLEFCGGTGRKIELLDLGTGSGCIAVILALELLKRRRAFHITALDVDSGAIGLARQNARRLGIEQHVTFVQSDWFSALAGRQQVFDIIVSNPPYVAEQAAGLSRELAFEPRRALFAGRDGMESIAHIMHECAAYLTRPGYFICEMGHDQKKAVEDVHAKLPVPPGETRHLTFYKDLAGRDRAFCYETGTAE